MARIPKNQISLRRLPNGTWRLFGYKFGERIRINSKDVHELEIKKVELEKEINKSLVVTVQPRLTRLTDAQIRDAEAAMERANGRSLLECVIAVERVMPSKNRKPAADALKEWLEI